jgi:hypothetical protein
VSAAITILVATVADEDTGRWWAEAVLGVLGHRAEVPELTCVSLWGPATEDVSNPSEMRPEGVASRPLYDSGSCNDGLGRLLLLPALSGEKVESCSGCNKLPLLLTLPSVSVVGALDDGNGWWWK